MCATTQSLYVVWLGCVFFLSVARYGLVAVAAASDQCRSAGLHTWADAAPGAATHYLPGLAQCALGIVTEGSGRGGSGSGSGSGGGCGGGCGSRSGVNGGDFWETVDSAIMMVAARSTIHSQNRRNTGN